MFDEQTEISKKNLAAWLEDTSDIVGRKFETKVCCINPRFKLT